MATAQEILHVLYVAVVRVMEISYQLNFTFKKIAAICSFNCYNGGICTAPNTCLCAPGWTGPTCTVGKLFI